MIRVLVADDHVVVRRGVIQILADAHEIEVTGEASSGREVLKAIREKEFDILLLDIAMPDGTGLDVLNELPKNRLRPKVLILSMYPEKQYALRALKAGASGYLTKDSAAEELLAAVRAVASGHKYVTLSIAEELASELAELPEKASHERLSDREYQVMCSLAEGKTVVDIAKELSLSVKTISTYRSRIIRKLGAKNTAEIIRYALQHGLVE